MDEGWSKDGRRRIASDRDKESWRRGRGGKAARGSQEDGKRMTRGQNYGLFRLTIISLFGKREVKSKKSGESRE